MNVEIRTEAAQFLEKENINVIFVAERTKYSKLKWWGDFSTYQRRWKRSIQSAKSEN